MPKPTAEEAQALFKELRELSRLQTKSIEDAAYLGMSPSEKEEFDKRRHRIQKICGIVAEYKPDGR
jgi:hypothetical protein